jgi:hypothetical protein
MIFRMSRGIISRDFSLHNLSVGFDEFSQKIINPNYFHLIALTMRIYDKEAKEKVKKILWGRRKMIWGGKKIDKLKNYRRYLE